MKVSTYAILLKWVLWLIALHSICYGIGLIVFPPEVFSWFGFNLPEKFFADQGGVFHLVISAVYIMAAMDLKNSFRLILLACFTKFSATIFLLSWYTFGMPNLMILFSGIIDFLMGAAILLLYLGYRKGNQD